MGRTRQSSRPFPFLQKVGLACETAMGQTAWGASCTRAECLVGGDNLPTTAGPLTDSVWLGLTTYCGMTIATLAAARDPILHRWETVTHWPHIICRVKHGWFPNLSSVGGAQTFRYGWGVPPIQEESGNRTTSEGLGNTAKEQLYVVHVPC